MKMLKTSLALAISTTLLFGCGDETTNNYYPQDPTVPSTTEAKIAVFNLSFDRFTYEDLVAFLDDPHPNVAGMAFYALGQRGEKRAIKGIIERIETSNHWYNQWYAYRALRTLGWKQRKKSHNS